MGILCIYSNYIKDALRMHSLYFSVIHTCNIMNICHANVNIFFVNNTFIQEIKASNWIKLIDWLIDYISFRVDAFERGCVRLKKRKFMSGLPWQKRWLYEWGSDIDDIKKRSQYKIDCKTKRTVYSKLTCWMELEAWKTTVRMNTILDKYPYFHNPRPSL